MHDRRRLTAAALGFPIGVGLLLAEVVINVVLIAVAGLVVTLAGTLWAVTSCQRDRHHHRARRRAGKQAGSETMGWLDERWRRRR